MNRRDLLIGAAALVVAGPVRALDDGVALRSIIHPGSGSEYTAMVVSVDYAVIGGDKCAGITYWPSTGAIETFEIELLNQERGLCLHAHS